MSSDYYRDQCFRSMDAQRQAEAARLQSEAARRQLESGVAQRRIQEQADAAQITREAVKNGMRTLRQSALQKLAEGKTSFEEVVRVTGL